MRTAILAASGFAALVASAAAADGRPIELEPIPWGCDRSEVLRQPPRYAIELVETPEGPRSIPISHMTPEDPPIQALGCQRVTDLLRIEPKIELPSRR
jgi:hypothetical protein